MASNDGLPRSVIEWYLDMETERKPYHRNCGCALHQQTAGCGVHKKVVSYKLRRAWSESCLVCTNATFSSSLTGSPATRMGLLDPLKRLERPFGKLQDGRICIILFVGWLHPFLFLVASLVWRLVLKPSPIACSVLNFCILGFWFGEQSMNSTHLAGQHKAQISFSINAENNLST